MSDLSINDFRRFDGCGVVPRNIGGGALNASALAERLAKARAAGWGDDERRPLRDWAGILDERHNMASVMWYTDPYRTARALAVVLEAIAGTLDTESHRAVIDLLRAPGRWAAEGRQAASDTYSDCPKHDWNHGHAAFLYAARAMGDWAGDSDAVGASYEAANTVAAAEGYAAGTIPIRGILLRAWEQG